MIGERSKNPPIDKRENPPLRVGCFRGASFMVKSINIDYADESVELLSFATPRTTGEALAATIKSVTLKLNSVIETHKSGSNYVFRNKDGWQAWARFNP